MTVPNRACGCRQAPDGPYNAIHSAKIVMPGLVPGIHDFSGNKGVDGRALPGHDAFAEA
jgi:hypothetical protein